MMPLLLVCRSRPSDLSRGFYRPIFQKYDGLGAKNDGSFDANNVSGKNLGSQRATSMGQYLHIILMAKTAMANLYDTQENAYLDLASGRVDAILAEKVQAASWWITPNMA